MATEPTDPVERAWRQARNSRYDGRGTQPLTALPPGIEPLPVIVHAPPLAPLPVAESEAVALGEVVNAQPYLSNDQTSIYTEFSIRVEEVLKNDSQAIINPGTTISAEHEGGALRLPSGRVLRFSLEGYGLPRAGGRYLFFLRHLDQGVGFSMLKLYELHEGSVYPLDQADRPNAQRRLPNSTADESTFLNAVREAVMSSQPESAEGNEERAAIQGACQRPTPGAQKEAWAKGALVNVRIDPLFVETEKKTIEAAFRSWEAANGTAGNGPEVKFAFDDTQPAAYHVFRAANLGVNLSVTGGNDDGFQRTSAYTLINSRVVHPTALPRLMIHEIGHTLGTNGHSELFVEAESGDNGARVKPRSNASGQQTALRYSGELLKLTFHSSTAGCYWLEVRYSNDNFGPLEEVEAWVDGAFLGRFTAQDTGDWGDGWNTFLWSGPLGVLNLQPGAHEITLTVSGGDGNGVEIDVVRLSPASSISPTSQQFEAVGGMGAVIVTTQGDCAVSVINPVTWIKLVSIGGVVGSNETRVTYHVAPNREPSPRTGMLTISGHLFTVTQAGSDLTPTLSSLSPSSALAGDPAFTLTVLGSNFVSGSRVLWNGINQETTFVSSTELSAAIPAANIATAGSASIAVSNPAPGGLSNALSFTVVPAMLLLEAEMGGGNGRIIDRSNASNQKTVLLLTGESRMLTFQLSARACYALEVRYSNDNFGPLETVEAQVDGALLGRFFAQDTGDRGHGWNNFVWDGSLGALNLQPGAHEVTLTVSGGDGYGVEIDVVKLSAVSCPAPGNAAAVSLQRR